MTWSAPMTAVAGSFTAAQWNTYVRDNLLETGPAKATAVASQWFCSSAANAIVARQVKTDYVATEQTRTSTSFGDLSTSGPSVTLTTGTKVLVMIACRTGNTTVNQYNQISYAISGATSVSADEKWGAISSGLEGSASAGDNIRTITAANLHTVTAGSNTFTMKYKVAGGTGRFSCRNLVVWSF